MQEELNQVASELQKALQEEDEKFMEWYWFQGTKADRGKLFEEYLKIVRRNNEAGIRRW